MPSRGRCVRETLAVVIGVALTLPVIGLAGFTPRLDIFPIRNKFALFAQSVGAVLAFSETHQTTANNCAQSPTFLLHQWERVLFKPLSPL
jgi:hypothetical protein